MRCPRCTHEQPDGNPFCGRCGADLAGVTPIWQGPSARSAATAAGPVATERAAAVANPSATVKSSVRQIAPWFGLASLICVAAVAVLVWVVPALDDESSLPNSAPDGTSSTDDVTARTALATLKATAKADSAIVETLVDGWVPQLGQYRVGIRDSAQVKQAAEVVDYHQTLRDTLGAVLLNSSDFQFRSDNLWVTVLPERYASANEALARCAALPATEQPCIARLLTRDDTIAVTSKPSAP